MSVDTSIIVAVAALAGSVVGACASVATTFVGNRLQARWARLAAELDERQELYGKFVEEAIPLFIDAIEQPASDPPKLMRFFSIIGRIRLIATDEVLRAAEHVGTRLLEAYERQPEDPVKVLKQVANIKGTLDPLREFTEACRRERAKILQEV